jgi:hypothetical protein
MAADSEPERRRGSDEAMAVIVHRLDAIEKRQEAAAKEQSRGFNDVRTQIAGLTFVRLDVYDADQRTADQVHKELGKDIGDLSTQMKLLWSVVGASVIAGLIGVLFQIASRS